MGWEIPPPLVMGVVKIIFGVLCFGVGVAFAIGAAELLEEPELGAPVAALGQSEQVTEIRSYVAKGLTTSADIFVENISSRR